MIAAAAFAISGERPVARAAAEATVGSTATARSANFVVQAATPELARQIADAAEFYRDRLAREWLGYAFPNWASPCRIVADTSKSGAGGATTFTFAPGLTGRTEVFNWTMKIQGPPDRLIDSVLPHEISHTIFASHFRRPLPRWADEGAATLAEDEIEYRRQRQLVADVLKAGRLIPLRKLLSMTQYPDDMQQVLTLYAQGFSLCDYLIQWRGRSVFLQLLRDAKQVGWDRAFQKHYRVQRVEVVESAWQNWVKLGAPPIGSSASGLQASRNGSRSDSRSNSSNAAPNAARSSAAGTSAVAGRRGGSGLANGAANTVALATPPSASGARAVPRSAAARPSVSRANSGSAAPRYRSPNAALPIVPHPVVRAQSPHSLAGDKPYRLAQAIRVFPQWRQDMRESSAGSGRIGEHTAAAGFRSSAAAAPPRREFGRNLVAPVPRQLQRPVLHQATDQ